MAHRSPSGSFSCILLARNPKGGRLMAAPRSCGRQDSTNDSCSFQPGRISCFLLLLSILLGVAACSDDDGGNGAPTPMPAATATPTNAPCPLPPPFCGGDFPLNTDLTTPYGPAWANVVLAPTNFLP